MAGFIFGVTTFVASLLFSNKQETQEVVGCRVLVFGCRVSGIRCRFSGIGFGPFRCRFSGIGFGYRFSGIGFGR